MFPELLVEPVALPVVMETASELVDAVDVALDATLDALNAYGTAVSLNLGVIWESAGVQLPHAQEPVPRIVIPR
jgi:hypothetical protein